MNTTTFPKFLSLIVLSLQPDFISKLPVLLPLPFLLLSASVIPSALILLAIAHLRHSPSMEVELYVYDLSQGLARSMSAGLLGIQIDAIYHTSIVFGGVEYVYDGGIKRVTPGMTHLGKPMEVLKLGSTELPQEVILEYLDSIKYIFTAQVGAGGRWSIVVQSANFDRCRHMTFGRTTVTTSPTTLRHF